MSNMNLKQIEDLTNTFKQTINWNLEDEPIKIRSFKMNRISTTTLKKSPEYGVIALYSPTKKQICFNERIVKDLQSIENIVKSSQETGHSVKTDKSKITHHMITHEYGHFVEDCIIQKRIQQNVHDWAKFKTSPTDADLMRKAKAKEIEQQIIQIAKEKYKANDKQLETSSYGQKNSFEFFAEVFAESQLHTTQKPLIQAMKDFLKEEK